jgi:metallo-beta-lactamase family protein
MKLTFEGAAGEVTGSLHRLSAGGKEFLLDCGMFQGRRKETERRNRNFPFDASSIDAVLLSHAHIDHSGRLPLLIKNGFRGAIYATPATIDLCRAMLRDTAHIAESDAAFVNHKHPGDPPVEPLYRAEDVDATLPLFRPLLYHNATSIAPGVTLEARDAGHILGSASFSISEGAVRLGYSGDLGRPGLPIIRDPETFPSLDYLIMESTYGGRAHPRQEEAVGKLEAIVKRTIGRGGRLIVPAFAVGRTQQLVLLLHQLFNEGRIPAVPIYVDSPLAVNVTDVFRAHPECFDEETRQYLLNGGDPFGFKRLTYIRDVNDSKRLNGATGPFIVISPSGMCEAGRVLHHLRHNIGDPKNTVLLTGYQAVNTLGRKLKEGIKTVRIFGIPEQVRAEIASLDALSGHADSGELLKWLEPVSRTLKGLFLVHGEDAERTALAAEIQEKYKIPVTLPVPGESFDLSN